MEATWTKERKLRAVFSWRVATRRNCLILLQKRSPRLRSLYRSVSITRCSLDHRAGPPLPHRCVEPESSPGQVKRFVRDSGPQVCRIDTDPQIPAQGPQLGLGDQHIAIKPHEKPIHGVYQRTTGLAETRVGNSAR
jgi:hypothetical protein